MNIKNVSSPDINCVLYFEDSKGETKYFGYQKDVVPYFKNISIINSRNQANLIERFNPPVFENTRTLSIPVNKKHAPSAGMVVMVTLDRDFFYTSDKNTVAYE